MKKLFVILVALGMTIFSGCEDPWKDGNGGNNGGGGGGGTSGKIPTGVAATAISSSSITISLTSVTLPNDLKSIGEYAFLDCKNLTYVNIPNSVTYIGFAAFPSTTKILYAEEENLYGQELIPKVDINRKCGFVDKTGKVIIPFKYDLVSVFSEGLAMVMLDNKYGFIDGTDRVVIPLEYEYANPFVYELTLVKLNDRWGCIDKTGKVIIPIIYTEKEAGYKGQVYLTNKMQKYTGNNFNLFAKQFIEKKINEWQQKDEFEKTEDWHRRVNENSIAEKKLELRKEAEQVFIEEYSKNYSLGNITLGSYDADQEVFLIKSDTYGDWLLPVPFNEARSFKANWDNLVKTPQFIIRNDTIALVGYEFSPLGVAVENNNVVEQKENQTISSVFQTTETMQSEIVKNNAVEHKENQIVINQTIEISQEEQAIEEVGIVSNPVKSIERPFKGVALGVNVLTGYTFKNSYMDVGFGAKLSYTFSFPIRLTGEFGILWGIPTNETWFIRSRWIDYGVNLQYLFSGKGKRFAAYPLVGIGGVNSKIKEVFFTEGDLELSLNKFVFTLGYGIEGLSKNGKFFYNFGMRFKIVKLDISSYKAGYRIHTVFGIGYQF